VTTPYLASDLRRDEGLRLHAYPDPLSGGEPYTIGFGHTGGIAPDTVWTLAQAEDALASDIAAACRGLDVVLPWWRSLDDVRADVLVNQAFNLGVTKLLTFTTYLSLVKAGDYAAAAADELHTAWARQVGARATRLAEQMRTGVHVGAADMGNPITEQPQPVTPAPVVAQPLPPLPAPPEPVAVQTPPVTPVAGPIVHPLPADDVPLMLAMWAGFGAFLVGFAVWLVTLFRRPKAKAVSIPVVQTVLEKEIPMSILSQALSGKITWQQAASQAEAWATSWVAKDPTATALAGTTLSIVKQGLSDAISAADTALAANKTNIALATDTALEAELAAVTKGLSLPANAFITEGIDGFVNAAVSAAHAWGLQAKSALGTTVAAPQPPAS
jgi:lysozyme